MNPNHDGSRHTVTLSATLPADANPGMMEDLYRMLELEVPAEPWAIVTTTVILHSVPQEDVAGVKARFEALFPGTTYSEEPE